MKYLKRVILCSVLFTAPGALSHEQAPHKELCEVLKSSADCYERALPHPEKPWSYQSDSVRCLFRLQANLEGLRAKYKAAPRYEMLNLIYNCDFSSGEKPDMCASRQLTNDMHTIGCL